MPRRLTASSSPRLAVAIVLAALAMLFLGAPALAQPQVMTWHRLNPGVDENAASSEHERFECMTGVRWVCRYDKVADEGFAWNRTIGTFHGRDITDSWDCPEWFAAALCNGTEQVISGQIVFVRGGGPALRVTNELILTDGSGDLAPLYIYWPDGGFVCPWYGTFAEARAANTGFAFDCDLAPLE